MMLYSQTNGWSITAAALSLPPQACRKGGGAAAPPDFGGSEGAAGQLPAPPDF